MADSYVNTRTIMGDQEAFDALIAGELEDLVEDGVTSISKSYAIYYNDRIKSIKLPNLTNMASNAIKYNANLEVIDIGKKCTFGYGSLTNNSKLNSLILRGAAMSTHGSSMLSDTPFATDHGGVFVPSDLVSTYKANSLWGAYNIYPIEDYPKSDWDTITDTWSEIFANEDNDTYSTKYSLGDTKKITINNNDYYAQIVAFDADPLSDNSGNAKITWILKKLYLNTHAINYKDTSTNSWPTSFMRSWLSSSILPLFPSDVRTAIKEVTKTSYDKTTSADVTSNDKLWIPSIREVYDDYSYTGFESSGPSYTTIFNSSSARIKYRRLDVINWWVRSSSGSTDGYFTCITGSGSNAIQISNFSGYGVCIGFCT